MLTRYHEGVAKQASASCQMFQVTTLTRLVCGLASKVGQRNYVDCHLLINLRQ